MAACPQCGVPISDLEAKTCVFCGTVLPKAKVVPDPEDDDDKDDDKEEDATETDSDDDSDTDSDEDADSDDDTDDDSDDDTDDDSDTDSEPPPPPPVQVRKPNKVVKIALIVVASIIVVPVLAALIFAIVVSIMYPDKPKPTVTAAEEWAQDGRLMCAEIQQRLTGYLKNKDIKCEPGEEAAGAIGLVVAYPLPILAKDDMARKDVLFVTVALAGEAMSKHPKTTVNEIYVVDSSGTSFGVVGELAQQIHTKLMNHQLSEKDGKAEVSAFAQRVKVPKKGS